ncbi:MAG: GAF domain-containing sensor histidine kinase [Microcoleaceae cyanobacterium]
MLMSASSEFVTLCHSQLALIASLGASLSVVYLTEEILEGQDAKLRAIATYPETSVEWEPHEGLMVLPPGTIATLPKLTFPHSKILTAQGIPAIASEPIFTSVDTPEEIWTQDGQIVLPLIHDGVVMGFLVSGRSDRPWNDHEELQLENIAHSLALGCILDQRSQWIQQQFSQQKLIQSQHNDILHSLLHQFKSPLTALKTFGKLLVKRLLPGDKNRDIAHSIIRESDRLKELLQQIDYTLEQSDNHIQVITPTDRQLEAEFHSPPLLIPASSTTLGLLPASHFVESVSLSEVLQPLLISAHAIAEESHLNLQAEIPDNLPPIQGNPKALREVLTNLIDNALKYTPSGGNVYIKVSQTSPNLPKSSFPVPRIAIAISDTGYGIPPQDLEHLFERYYRGEKSQTDIPGTGLGLAIARDLIHEMQGEIEVFSPLNCQWLPENVSQKLVNKNQGTTFLLWLRC